MLDRAQLLPPSTDEAKAPRPASVQPKPGLYEPLGNSRYSRAGLRAKRVIDLTVSVSILIVAAPLLLALWAAIRATSPGAAVFRQTRLGHNEKPFTIFKFRTMDADNDDTTHRDFVQEMLRSEPHSAGDAVARDAAARDAAAPEGNTYKLVEDPRITPVGRWLRRTSLDELPQLINVIRGEMSLVGPRPCLEYEASEFLPRHRLRATSTPGITGLWQVSGRNDTHMKDALDIDVTYVQSCSLRLDIVILAKTIKVVISGSGY